MQKRCLISLLAFASSTVLTLGSPFTLPPTVKTGERIAAEIATPGLDYNDPVALVCPGRDEVRCASIEIQPDLFVDVYWPSGEITKQVPVVLMIANLPRRDYLDKTGKPFRRYVPVISWAADIASRGMIAVVPDVVLPGRDYPVVLDWINTTGPSLGMEPTRQAYFVSGYASAFLPALTSWESSKQMKVLIAYYSFWMPSQNVKIGPDVAFQLARVGKGWYITQGDKFMLRLVEQLKAAGNPVDVIDLPNSLPFFDWKQFDAEAAAALDRTLTFMAEHLK